MERRQYPGSPAVCEIACFNPRHREILCAVPASVAANDRPARRGCVRGDSAVGASRFARPFGARIALIVDAAPRAIVPQSEHVGAACLADPGDVAADGVANDGIERAVFRFGNPRQFGDDRCRQID
ncbi:hypothetical protein [Burkholderia multivorans]|uniref:hypothetical protein n=1 Tax=Burkholderia multivorans TaxID=87883 RepID=UPI001C2354EE|nr:hypothetical protein [Burkholderia multivorans]MBU9160032.1 hypothetical protein [Burkholderia multivorans]MBU9541299.1 hypothetical protein [Burkholderia multivorans]MCA8173631.1 hypothetical protein [Burkholderia multivorans]